MVNLPIFELKTPLKIEKINYKNKIYLVNSRINVNIYKISELDFRSVITKDISFKNGKFEHILLEYFKELNYEDILDVTDDFIEKVI